MKKTDVTQPVAMATPFAEGVYSATSTEDFEIPAATSSTADDSCVMDNGFLPITSTALDDGGKAPERKNFNGMFYLSTDQRFFLQNGGFITYNPDVATAIGGYPQDAILDFIDSNGNYKKVRSLIDDNSNNFVADETLIDGTNWEEIQMGGGSGYEVGDIVIRNTPTNDAGKHLLDGALIQYGSYKELVDRIADLYNNTPAEDVYNINIVGSLTNDNGVLSGFSASNYATLPLTFNPSSSNWDVVVPITTASSFIDCDFFASTVSSDFGIHAQLHTDGKIYLYLSSNGTSHNIASNVTGANTLSVNTKYWIKIAFNGTSYNVYSSTTGEFNGEEITEITVNSSAVLCTMTTTVLGRNPNPSYPNPFNGSIDLNGCYININGSRFWSGKSEKRAGFLTEDEWQATVTTYGSCGKYVYDSVNNTVRLPKVSDILQGTTDLTAIGDLVKAGLPNITGTFGTCEEVSSTYSGAFSSTLVTGGASGSSTGASLNVTMDASRSNSIYGNSSTVQPQTIKVLFYIVIANSTKTDIQVDIDEIATDLNGKADVDLTNVNDSGTSKGAGWAMPSGTLIDLTLGASGTTYIAPANGWFTIRVVLSNGFLSFNNNSNSAGFVSQHSGGNALTIPMLKGQELAIEYSNLTSIVAFKFIYAQGSESEAS